MKTTSGCFCSKLSFIRLMKTTSSRFSHRNVLHSLYEDHFRLVFASNCPSPSISEHLHIIHLPIKKTDPIINLSRFSKSIYILLAITTAWATTFATTTCTFTATAFTTTTTFASAASSTTASTSAITTRTTITSSTTTT